MHRSGEKSPLLFFLKKFNNMLDIYRKMAIIVSVERKKEVNKYENNQF